MRLLLLLLLNLSLSGCSAALVGERQSAGKPETGRIACFHVDGLVESPGQFKLPEKGVLLLQALRQAGGPRKGGDAEGQAPRLVCLERSRKAARERLFFPLDFVLNDVAGRVSIEQDDAVKVVSYEQTGLGMQPAKAAKAVFTVDGIVERPGKYEIKSGLDAVVNVLTPEYAGALQSRDDERVMLVLTRAGSPTWTERYYLPLFPPHSTRHVLLAVLGAGDQLQYVRVGELPLFQVRGRLDGAPGH